MLHRLLGHIRNVPVSPGSGARRWGRRLRADTGRLEGRLGEGGNSGCPLSDCS